MAQAAAPATDAIAADAVEEFTEYSKYKGYTIIVPMQFSPDVSDLLMKLQVLAIDAGAVSLVERDAVVNMAAWTTEDAPRPCLHINFRRVQRKNFDYQAFLPLSLVEQDNHVVAGVCVTSLSQVSQLRKHFKFIPLEIDEALGKVLNRVSIQRRHRSNGGEKDHNTVVLAPKCELTASRCNITPPSSAEKAHRMPATQFYLRGGPSTSPTSGHLIANPASDGNIKRDINDHFSDTKSTKLPRRWNKSCDRCHRMKIKCWTSFPCPKCTESGSECFVRRKTLKLQQNTSSRRSPSRPPATSFSIPTPVPYL